ncbi:MAG: class I SAM-dependent methyltransferase [Planctomycetota bacterium]
MATPGRPWDARAPEFFPRPLCSPLPSLATRPSPMVRRSNRRYHDRVAGRYDAVYDRPYWRFYRELSWRHLKPFLPAERPARAADLGCGTGWFGRRLLKAGFDLVFLDPSGAMLEQARARVEEDGTRGRELAWVQAGLEDMAEVATDSLAFATAQGDPLSFCDDPRRALAELARVVAPGGVVVLSVDNRVAGVRSLLGAATPDEALELCRTGRTAWLARRSEEAFPMKMFEPGELEHLFDKAGFEPLSTIGKTCIVQRDQERWLEDPRWRKLLLQAEERVHARPHWLGLASHLQVAARRR